MLPDGPSIGSTPEYDDLVRAWDDLRQGLPPINGWSINESLPDIDAIGKAYLEYDEIGEFPFWMFEDKEAPEKALAEYRHRLNKARRTAVRDRMQELVAMVDTLLPQTLAQAAGLEAKEKLNADSAAEIDRAITEIERLMGDTAARGGRWGDLHRHLRFGQAHDWNDIHVEDWPSVKPDIEAAMFSDVEPMPVPDIDLGTAAGQRPTGSVSTALQWDELSPDRFEHLLHDLLGTLPGYQNVQLLMKTNAADRGRDISAERVLRDGSGSVRTERVIVQAKHWLSRSVPPEEISSAITRIKLWEPPVIRGLIVATSGHFTPDAVAWVEKHNDGGVMPLIDLWPAPRLRTLLSERPWLAVEYGLR